MLKYIEGVQKEDKRHVSVIIVKFSRMAINSLTEETEDNGATRNILIESRNSNFTINEYS